MQRTSAEIAMSARERVLGLMAKKEALEREIVDLSEALGANNMGGVSGALVDREGFPRADIDVHTTRTMRHRLAVLNTDHKELMAQIEAGLQSAMGGGGGGSVGGTGGGGGVGGAGGGFTANPKPAAACTAAPAGPSPSPMRVDESPDDESALEPFAELDEIAAGGPAESAGARVGDRLLRFGGVVASNHDGLRALVRLTQRSEGDVVPLLVERQGARVLLELLPRRWAGAGLLGCHLRPLS